MKVKGFRAFAVMCSLFIAGFLLGYHIRTPLCRLFSKNSDQSGEEYHIIHQKGYSFINPLLDIEYEPKAMPQLKTDVKEYIEKKKKEGNLTEASLYFRKLNTGMSFSVNESFKFSPASLLKVPLMIACLKQAEIDMNFLSHQIKFDIPVDSMIVPNFRYGEPIQPGGVYTVEDLIVRLILNSDNNAGMLLLSHVDDRILDKVYSDLEIAMPWIPGIENYMTVKDYSKFIRILYNATYLNRDMSEFALYIMSLSEFHTGIIKGVGPNVTVSHKFGERDISGIKQLHDCGIVYYEEGQCLLCIMTRGNEFKHLENVIADITKIITENIDPSSLPE